jgi:hypothetical protein
MPSGSLKSDFSGLCRLCPIGKKAGKGLLVLLMQKDSSHKILQIPHIKKGGFCSFALGKICGVGLA